MMLTTLKTAASLVGLCILCLTAGCAGAPDKVAVAIENETPEPFEPVAIEVAPPEEVGDNRYFYGTFETSDIDHGGFEEPFGADGFPVGWKGLVTSPTIRQDTFSRLGESAVKLTGSREKQTHLRTTTAPPSDELHGKEVVFGMWVYTTHPEKTHVQIIEDWQKYTNVHATEIRNWELLKVTRVIPDSAENILMAVSLGANNPPVVCYVDGAALIVSDAGE